MSVAAASLVIPQLAAPDGRLPVGTEVLHLVDEQRTDPWPDAAGQPRELMVTVHYPARTVRGYPLARQMSPLAARHFGAFDARYIHPELPDSGVDWQGATGRAHTGAPARSGRYPVLLYSPAAGDPRTLNTALAEDLASRGNIVVSMDHPGETSEVEFPGGRLRGIALPGPPGQPDVFSTILQTRLADTRFVLGELTGLASGTNPDAEGRRLPERLGRALDLGRAGMYGHSIGGTTAAQALYEDPRIDVAVNLEGYLDHPGGELLPVARYGTSRPLLLYGTDGFRDERFARGWAAMRASGTCVRQETVASATHWVFSDFATIAPQLQAAGLMTAEQRKSLIGAVEPPVSVPAIRDTVAGFFSGRLR
ncbi:hypothetical protein [Longispora albida]|uniref:alpha/beta hydrolase n=1 Tax=Longispora albida TaxID=203523 RepID=UPI0003815AA6|nr:hypothetical protein [Longispora albida]